MTDLNSTEVLTIFNALNDASVIDIKRTTTKNDIVVILSSGQAVEELQPQFDAILMQYANVQEGVELCGHATLAAAHALFSSGLVNSNIIEFVTLSRILTAKKFQETKASNSSDIQNGESQDCFLIELDFPTVPTIDFNSEEVSSISSALNGASVIDIKKTSSLDALFVVLPSGESVVEIRLEFDTICKCPEKGIIVSGAAPSGSGFDFYSRFFAPKLGVNEDPVCGSAHCALAPYWSKKLGKCDFVAFAASPRSGVLNIHLDEHNQRVLLRGKAVTVMEGTMHSSLQLRLQFVVAVTPSLQLVLPL
ncbi:hypothetical protein RGQ29_007971 [Quercus rubra]|uniref:Uncharacterized protein n=1 Tax=Quercus rubra TaxID=3512 RepID=A0AAN7DZ29_QUERU|nr:hypothetical protein RGQ29_007971 [Quercus rubra]